MREDTQDTVSRRPNKKAPLAQHGHPARARDKDRKPEERDPLIRAENEDDDGYDPYSDRTAGPEPLFERDPWD